MDKIFVNEQAWNFKAIFEHPDTGHRWVDGVMVTSDNDDNFKEEFLNLFRELWQREGHYFHNLMLQAVYYSEFEGVMYRFERSVEGSWYEDDDDIKSRIRYKHSMIKTGEGAV